MKIGSPTLIYLDANAIIQLIEGEDPAAFFLAEMAAANLLRLSTSQLSLAEVLVKPLKQSQRDLIALYTDIMSDDDFIATRAIDRTILMRSAELRAQFGLKGPDAIHIATALAEGCTIFVSSDKRMAMPPGLIRLELHQLHSSDE